MFNNNIFKIYLTCKSGNAKRFFTVDSGRIIKATSAELAIIY